MNIKTLLFSLFALCLSFITLAQSNYSNKYYGHLRYNHVSPYIKFVGTYPMDSASAKSTSHYVFKYNDDQLIEITNNHYFTEKKHSLASIGAYTTAITYDNNEETRVYFDKTGKRISNDREVYKEVYSKNKKGDYTELEFFDIDDNPMESNWEISKYTWFKKRNMIIENRFNLEGEPRDLSTYFEFGTTGMRFRKDGSPIANYNLNEDLAITNNSVGVASYQDTFDENGNHVKYTYHDADNNLVMNKFGLAVGTKVYDAVGNYIRQESYDPDMQLLRSRDIPSNQHVILSSMASQEDTLEIKRISQGYLIALQELAPDLMDEVMNDSLNKVTIGYNRALKKEVVRYIPKERMIQNAETWNKSNTRFPPTPSNQVTILDIYNRMATVKLYSDNWVEYLHLIKLDGKWSIVNLLWQHKDINRYPKE